MQGGVSFWRPGYLTDWAWPKLCKNSIGQMNTKGGQLIGELSKVQILLEGHKILKNYLVIGEIFFKILRPLRKTELYLFMSLFSHLHDLLSTIKNCQLPSNIIRAGMVEEFWLHKNIFQSMHFDSLLKQICIFQNKRWLSIIFWNSQMFGEQ